MWAKKIVISTLLAALCGSYAFAEKLPEDFRKAIEKRFVPSKFQWFDNQPKVRTWGVIMQNDIPDGYHFQG